MKQSFKKTVSILLSLIMIFSVFAIVPLSASAEEYEGFGLYGEEGTVLYTGDTIYEQIAFEIDDEMPENSIIYGDVFTIIDADTEEAIVTRETDWVADKNYEIVDTELVIYEDRDYPGFEGIECVAYETIIFIREYTVSEGSYYLIGTMTGNPWEFDASYELTANTENEGEYYIKGVEFEANDAFKVVYTNDGTNFTWYPDNGGDYGINSDGIYDIYFRPDYQGGGDWHCGCIYAADVTPQTYTVTWKDWDGGVFEDTEVEEGDYIYAPYDSLTRDEDDDYTYTFSGWTDGTNTYAPTDEFPPVTGDITYTATYEATAKYAPGYYLVGTMNNWAIEAANLLAENPQNQGEYMISGYEFTANDAFKVMYVAPGIRAWFPDNDGNYVINSDGTYDIYFRPDYQGGQDWFYGSIYAEKAKYTVTWKNEDGSVIDTTTVSHGDTPTHADATKANETFYSYTFAGWNDGENTYAPSELPAVTGDVTYTATFTAVPFSEVTVTTKADFETAIANNSVDTIIIGADIASGYAGSGNIVSYRKNVNRTLTIKCVGSEKYSLKGYAFRVGSDTSKAASLSFENVIIDGNCPNAISANDYDFFMTVVGANSSLNFKDGAVICNFYHKRTQSVIEAGRGSNASGNNIQGNGLKGTINVYDGAEFYNLGAQFGIFRLNGNAVMNMYGGTVRNCTTYDKEAIVAYIANGAAFNMSGGEIKNCTGTSSSNNSVVYLGMWGNSTFTMTGGTITSNTAKHSVFLGTTGSSKITIGGDAKIYGGSGSSNIYLANGRTITMHDTHLTEEADIWLYTATNPSDTADVKIATNAVKDDIAHIHSDNTVNAGVVYCDGETDWVYLNGVMTKLNNGAAHHTHTANTIWLSTAANDSNIEVNTTQAVTWNNWDGATIKTDRVAEGNTPSYDGETPTHAADAQYTYTFTGWTDGNGTFYAKDAELPAVTGDVTYTAVFDSTVNEYTITWKNDDGTVIDTTQVAYGTVPTHADPTKDADEEYTYTFAGWDVAPVAVTGDETYTATFTAQEILFGRNGLIFDEYGNLRFYKNDKIVYSKGLVQDDAGHYYYINSSGKAVKNCYYSFSTAKANGLMQGGTYYFDENGVMSIPRNGLTFEGNGVIRYYENDQIVYSKGLVQDNEGNLYYINSSGKAVKNCYYAFSAARSNGLMPAGEYWFDADGKLTV